MTLTDEGYVVGQLICPYDDNPPWNARCAMSNVTGEPVPGCFVIADFAEVGMESFKGNLELPTIDIEWAGGGSEYHDGLSISPVVAVSEEVATR